MSKRASADGRARGRQGSAPTGRRTAAGPAAAAQPPTAGRPPASPARARTALPPISWRAHALALVCLAGLALGLYAPALHGPFVYDDPNAVTQSALVRQIFPLGRFVTLSTRPLSDFSYALNYAASGYATWSYHLTSMLLHAASTLLLYGIAVATFATPALAPRYGAARFALACAAAALFAAHPLASESVAYVSSRSEVLVAFFYLLAIGSYLVAATTTDRRRRRVATVLLPVAAAAGLGSKEIAAVIPFTLLLYDVLFFAGGRWERTRPRRRLVALSALPLAIGGVALLIRAYVLPSPMGAYGATAGIGFERFGRSEYAMTQFGVIMHYLRLVVLPFGQTFDYDWPLARSPIALGVVMPFLALAAIVVAAVRLARAQPLFTFAIAWTLLILAPTSSVLPIADLAVERRMYLPLAGLALLAAAWTYDLILFVLPGWRARVMLPYAALTVLLVGALAGLTYQRTRLWGDAIALHEDGVAKAPGNPRVRLNLGVTYLNSGRQEDAFRTLLQAKALFDANESIHAFPRIGAFIQYNLGAVLYARKEYDRAEPELRRSLELGGQYLALRPMALMLLSRIAAQKGDWKTAAAQLQEAIQYQDNLDWRVDLAQMQLNGGDREAARRTLVRVLMADPNQARAKALLEQVRRAK